MLGRPDCGRLAPGKRADIAIWDTRGALESAGSWDPAALLLAGPTRVKHLFVEGRQIVRDGQITTIDLPTRDRTPEPAGAATAECSERAAVQPG